MFKFIENDMPLKKREELNFILGCVFLSCCIFTVYFYISPFKFFVVMMFGVDIIIANMFRTNNRIGLNQTKNKKGN